MNIYPYDYPIILTDDVFTGYGGLTGTSLPLQREAAYIIAEQQVSTYLGTFLLPTVVTGSVPYNPHQQFVSTEFGYVHNVKNIRVLNPDGDELWNVSGTYQYFTIQDDTFGYIRYRDIPKYPYPGACYDKAQVPSRLEYVYEAGLPTGTANQPGILMALVQTAQINLSEMVFPFSNETAGDAGVTEFESLDYKEVRKLWKNTALGSSAKSAYAARMIDSTIKKARKSLVIR